MDNNNNYKFENQKIIEVEMEKEVKKSFIEYSMSVIVARALPDVRDGLKPVHRRILYAMYEDHLTYDKPFRKSATTVGNVLGRYHPHGDTAVYDTMVRMAQPFSLRYPLIEGHGNFGNIDGDDPAAYRYTEARMSRLADEMMSDIEKDVVEFMPNFDNRRTEPAVLPSRFPNLLVNGSIGIAVGMATNIPPHNLNEVIDAAIYLMENPSAGTIDLMNYIKGPDFPTYAAIAGAAGIYEAYATGRGRVMVKAKAAVEEDKRRIVVTEIPYQVNKVMLLETMVDCVKDKRIEGITDIRDESGRDGLKIVIEYRREANGQIILNQLYKHTKLQDFYAINMLALVDNVPKVLNVKEILEHYIKHQKEIIENRIRYDLKKAWHETHINEGYIIALDNIDAVINIIRASRSVSEARTRLTDEFNLSDIQTQAIVEMPLGRLSGIEREKINERLEKLRAVINELQGVLSDESKVVEIIKTELLEIKRKFGDERRTEIFPVEDEIIIEDLIERHTCLITMTHAGYIKRRPSDSYAAQRRGGKGVIGMATKEEDFVEHVIAVNSHSYLLMFTNTGKIFTKKAYQIPEAPRTSKGSNVINIIDLAEGEKITALISVDNFNADEYLIMVTKQGKIKRTPLSLYEPKRPGGKIALNLLDGDELMFVCHTKGESDVLLATAQGYALRINETALRVMSRNSIGVIGVKLYGGDSVAGAALVDENKKIFMITERGYGKRCNFDEFTLHHRGGKGVKCNRTDEKRGMLAGITTVDDTDDIMIITDDGVIIRTPVSAIPVIGRSGGGVIAMRPSEGAVVVNCTKLEKVYTEDEETE